MTIPPLPSGGLASAQLRQPVLTAPVSTGVPPLIGDGDAARAPAATSTTNTAPQRGDAPITLAGRLDVGDTLPDTTRLALALESATRALLHGRADQILSELDGVWSQQLAVDSPWYLRTAALQLLGRTSDAEQVLRDAIARLPRSAAMLYLLGVHTAHRGQYDAARLANDHALALHPTEPLLWLQRAALAEADAMHGTAEAMLQQVLKLDPSLPARQWLATLTRLGARASRATAHAAERPMARLTPSSVTAINTAVADAPQPASLSPGELELSLRFGLVLLESPTQSARMATQSGTSSAIGVDYASAVSGAAATPPTRSALPAWESLILVAGLLVVAFVPPLRIPALMFSGAVTMLLISRTLR